MEGWTERWTGRRRKGEIDGGMDTRGGKEGKKRRYMT